MIGGMVGNNSSGTTSIQFGVTRDKVIALNTILSDGSEVKFHPLKAEEYRQKMIGSSLENKIYKSIYNELSNPEIRKEITKEFPKSSIHRRNNGYAVDALMDSDIFLNNSKNFNLSKLLCGSEGTLAFTTDITLTVNELPPKENILIAAHFSSIHESMKAVVVAMKHNLYMCELMDKTILDCTKNNREQIKNRFFVEANQYAKKFIPAAKMMAKVIPVLPPKKPPIQTKKSVIMVSSINVFKVFIKGVSSCSLSTCI